MKTALTVLGLLVAVTGIGFAIWYLTGSGKITLTRIDWLNKSVEYKTGSTEGIISLSDLETKGNFGVTKNNSTLNFKLLPDEKIEFSLMENGALVDRKTVDFKNHVS